MEKVVVDTSVIVKWFVDEEYTDEALQLLSDFRNKKIDLFSPAIVVLELANALRFNSLVENDSIEKSVEWLYLTGISLVNFDLSLVKKSLELSFQNEIAMYDALFLAIALKLNIPLITADSRHHKPEYYSKVLHIAEYD